MEDKDKELNSVTSQEGDTTETEFDPVQAINELKQNSVSKEQYQKVVEEKNKYLKALIDGNQVAEAQPKEPVNIDELRNSLFGEELNNLDYAKKTLELRDAIIEKKNNEIFVGTG